MEPERVPPVCAHHDDQQYVLEVVSEAQSRAAEQGEVSLQELREKEIYSVKFDCNTHTHKHAQLWTGAHKLASEEEPVWTHSHTC